MPLARCSHLPERMATGTLYKDILLEHFRHPRNKGDLHGADVVRRGSNPRCGDEVEVGLSLHGDQLLAVRFRGRGCSLCVASASLMTEAVNGITCSEARKLCTQMQDWFEQGESAEPLPALAALAAVRGYPARRRCVLLSWEALAAALDSL
jgi:nitrogen fixation NifU-like protein